MNQYTLIQGDCLEVLPTLEDESIDLVVTSPPYNVGMPYPSGDNLTEKEYEKLIIGFLRESERLLIDGGRICINLPGGVGRNPYNPIGYTTMYLLRNKTNLILRGSIIWFKGFLAGKTTWGSYNSCSNPALRDFSELIIVAHKGNPKKIGEQSDLKSEEFLEWTKDVWFISPESAQKIGHPAPFPEELPYRCIKLYSYVGDVVLDPFLGSGTTLKVAQELRRSCIGIEVEPEYIEKTRKRCWGRQFLDRKVTYDFEIHSSLSRVNE